MRVAAGKHFPSDVVGGAALGVTSAVVVHAIRF
jgi:membrane-associated phospholipid phosphatase